MANKWTRRLWSPGKRGAAQIALAAAVFSASTGIAMGQQSLTPATAVAFARFIDRIEESMTHRETGASGFLWMGEDAGRLRAVRAGERVIERLDDAASLDGAMIHNWIGGVFVAGVTIDDILAVFLDYDRFPEIYPGIIDSRLVESRGDVNRLYQRLRRDDIVLDTWHEAGYRKLEPGRAVTWSRSTQIREVENVGQADEALLPEGEDRGYMWRVNVYWRLEENSEGVFAECHSISLTRDVPFLLRWLVNPFVRRIPRRALEQTLEGTRLEAQKRAGAAALEHEGPGVD